MRKAINVSQAASKTSSPTADQTRIQSTSPETSADWISTALQQSIVDDSGNDLVMRAIRRFRATLPSYLNGVVITSEGVTSVNSGAASLQFIIGAAELKLKDSGAKRPTAQALQLTKRMIGIIALLQDEVSNSTVLSGHTLNDAIFRSWENSVLSFRCGSRMRQWLPFIDYSGFGRRWQKS